MAKALRDGFVVPLPLCGHFFTAVLGEDLPLEALPHPGDGYVGEFVGAAARFAVELRQRYRDLEGDARALAYADESRKPGWGKEFLKLDKGGEVTADWSFEQYVRECCMTFREFGVSGQELCEGGENKSVDAANLDEFVENAALWWLREGIMPQVAAFRQGVEEVCASSAIWAFEAADLGVLFCGDHVKWTRKELQQNLRPRSGVEASDMEMLIDVLDRLDHKHRGQFLEFVTACPRLQPGGLASAKITIAPASPPGSLPRARTCTKELRLPKYESIEQLEAQLICAIENAEGLYDDDRMA